jgi:hypothetical protein
MGDPIMADRKKGPPKRSLLTSPSSGSYFSLKFALIELPSSVFRVTA